MSEAPTELDLSVGSLFTTDPKEDAELFAREREMINDLQEALAEQGVMVDLLAQPGTEIWEGGIEHLGDLYQLSRLATYIENDRDLTPVLDDGPILIESDLDTAVTDVWDGLVQTRFPNLVYLQGIYSYYLPVEFPAAQPAPIWLPLEMEETGEQDEAFFGSSVALQRELSDLYTMLTTAGVPVTISAMQCLATLRTAAEQSVSSGFPIIVW